MRGTKDGEVIIKNIKPKSSGGAHEVIDETFLKSASLKSVSLLSLFLQLIF
jgi:hypothetical protein